MNLTKSLNYPDECHSRLLMVVACAVLLVVAGGCGMFRGQTAPQPVTFSIHISGEEDLNGGGNAAFVHVYQLADNAGLRNALPESFWQSPEQTLGESLLSVNQVQLFPGSDEALTVELRPGTRYVGIAANLRAPDRDRWRTFVPVTDVGGRMINVTVGSNSVTAELQ